MESEINLEDELDHIDDPDSLVSEIDSANTIHDSLQFQCRFDYDLEPVENELAKTLELDLYFFLPHSMGIQSDTYDHKQFFSNLTNYFRIKTPFTPSWFQTSPEEMRLHYSDRYLDLSETLSRRKRLTEAVNQEVKLFGCFINTLLKKLLKSAKNSKNVKEKVQSSFIKSTLLELEDIQLRINAFRKLYMARVEEFGSLIHSDVRRTFHLVNEYVSFRYEDNLIAVMDNLPLASSRFREKILKLLKTEADYRKRHVHSGRAKGSARAETFHYRLGLLKKFVSSVLYLKSRSIKKDNTIRNIIAATGAAMAAAFATMARVQELQMLKGPEANFRLGIIFVFGVLAYVLKDRIKDLSKEYFNNKLKKYLPDNDFELYNTHFDSEGTLCEHLMGTCKEFMTYQKKKSLPPEIQYIRDLERRDELEPERPEEVIQFSKKILVNLEDRPKEMQHVNQIKDLIRFDVTDMLRKLSEPLKSWKYFDENGSITSTDAPKVYHLNVVLRYSLSQRFRLFERRKVEYERFRLVLDKSGIKRLEKVVPRGELAVIEDVA